jgi:hypothetical protein
VRGGRIVSVTWNTRWRGCGRWAGKYYPRSRNSQPHHLRNLCAGTRTLPRGWTLRGGLWTLGPMRRLAFPGGRKRGGRVQPRLARGLARLRQSPTGLVDGGSPDTGGAPERSQECSREGGKMPPLPCERGGRRSGDVGALETLRSWGWRGLETGHNAGGAGLWTLGQCGDWRSQGVWTLRQRVLDAGPMRRLAFPGGRKRGGRVQPRLARGLARLRQSPARVVDDGPVGTTGGPGGCRKGWICKNLDVMDR